MTPQSDCRHIQRALILAALVAAVFIGCAGANALAQAPTGSTTHVTREAYPTGDPATSVILLERSSPAEVRVGESFEYTVMLSNLTARPVQNLVLTEELPPDFDLQGIVPEPDRRDGPQATWNLGTLEPRGSKTIRIKGSARRTGELPSCATVTFQTKACSSVRIVQPELELVKTAPAEVVLCDPIPLKLVVSNRGSGVARNVTVTDPLPDGWATADGRSQLTFQAGDLAAGQSREFAVDVRSSNTGQFTNQASAQEAGGLTADASSTTRVVKPMLALTKKGPDVRYIGRPAKFELTVTNDGDAPARDAVLVDTVPTGARFDQASDSGQFGGNKVTWPLGTIAAGDSRTVTVTITPTQRGILRNDANVRAYCAAADASASLEVRGIPAILLEVVDIHDPIEVGANETYEIVIVNQGSAEGTNIVITCMLPPEQQFVSAEGPTKGEAQAQKVVFAPLDSLDPKAKVTYRVVVKGISEGDVRFKVTLMSDQLDSVVEETESTHVY